MKKTKILATISDLKCDVSFLKSLYEQGVNCFRMNTAHQTPFETKRVVNNIRKVSDKIGIVIDTKGPEVRTREVKEPIKIKNNQKIKIMYGNENKICDENILYVSYKNFVKEVKITSNILIDDGELKFKILQKKKEYLLCQAKNSGILKSKKSVNAPNSKLNLPSLIKKDKDYLEFCAKNKIDFVAHSFVRNKEDVLLVRKILNNYKAKTKIISKIEDIQGVNKIDEIIDNSDGIMIARGDLAIEIPMEKIPIYQKIIIDKCREKQKISLVATQMLHTMIENPRPTRAEITDISNAVLQEADCLMLSGETAFGKYPKECVKTMTKIIKNTEKAKLEFIKKRKNVWKKELENTRFLCHMADYASKKSINIKAIISETRYGRAPKILSSFRPNVPIFIKAKSIETLRQTSLEYGIFGGVFKNKRQINSEQKEFLKKLISFGAKKEDYVIYLGKAKTNKFKGIDVFEFKTISSFLK